MHKLGTGQVSVMGDDSEVSTRKRKRESCKSPSFLNMKSFCYDQISYGIFYIFVSTIYNCTGQLDFSTEVSTTVVAKMHEVVDRMLAEIEEVFS